MRRRANPNGLSSAKRKYAIGQSTDGSSRASERTNRRSGLDLSRRDFGLCAVGAAVIPVAYWSASSGTSRVPRADRRFSDYKSTLVNGITPGHVAWDGRKWRCAMGSTWNRGMDHSLRLAPGRARFEIREGQLNRGPADDAGKRRSEIRFPKAPRLPNAVPLWGAMSFVHHQWDDPAGMAANWGGVHGQLHIGSEFGGSPAVAFRRTRRGAFAITTRGERDSDGSLRYERPLPFDALHSLVYRVVLGPKDGALDVWLNGEAVVNVRGVSIGSSDAECYWSLGCYYSGGVSCPIIAEYGDHFYPGLADLNRRIRFKPDWGPAAA